MLNLGWRWNDVAKHLERTIKRNMSAKSITNKLLGACDQLYMQKPGDDATVATIKAIKQQKAVIFSGPPIDKKKDKEIVEKILKTSGKKIVCGGTAGNIVARHLKKK